MNRAFIVIFLSAVAYAIYAAVHEDLHALTLLAIAIILLVMLILVVSSRNADREMRAGRADGDPPLVSLVILLSRPMAITEADIRDRLQRVFGETFGDQPTDLNLVKQFRSDMVGVQVHGWKYGIISRAERYIRDEPPEIDKLDERLRLALRQHQAWLSVDAFGEALDMPHVVYPTMGRILAEFVDDSALAVYGTDTGRMMYVTDDTADLLRSGQPMAALELRDPSITIESEDPRVQSSVATAHRRWPEFVAAFEHRHPGQGFSVKASFSEDGSAEAMWIDVERLDGKTVAGLLANSPETRTDLKLGDPVTIDLDAMEDWLFEGHQGIEGGFSMRVIRDDHDR